MNYSSLHPAYVVKQKIYVDKKTIFIVLPDTNLDISTEIYHINFLLSNCMGLVCPNKTITIGKRKFNGKAHFYDVKKKLTANIFDQKISRKIKVSSSLIIEKPDKDVVSTHKSANYYFYDATVWSQALEYMMQRYPERTVVKQLFEELVTLYNQIKSNNQDYNIEILFLIKNQSGRLYNIISNIRSYIKVDDLKSLKFFDDYTIISDCQNVLIPIFNSEDGETKLIITNLSKLELYIEANVAAESINQATETPIIVKKEDTSNTEELNKESKQENQTNVSSTLDNKPKVPEFISNIVQSLQTSKLVANVDPNTAVIKVKLNQDELKKALKLYKITDPDIIANVQIALNHYVNSKIGRAHV